MSGAVRDDTVVSCFVPLESGVLFQGTLRVMLDHMQLKVCNGQDTGRVEELPL
jgi:hypothetical protein